jgi:hypothetical protein
MGQCSKINQSPTRRPTKILLFLAFLVYIRQNPLPKEEEFYPKWLYSQPGGRADPQKKNREY